MKKSLKFAILIPAILSFSIFSILITNSSFILHIFVYNNNGFVLKTADWSNATCISDDYTLWNDANSEYPDITIDNNGNIHVVWKDWTTVEWGGDEEIFYASYNGSAWSNATCISDDATNWNKGESSNPAIAIDNNGNIHVVWMDNTAGEWGVGPPDSEIMYANYTAAGWSNATVISDDYTLWNDDVSEYPDIAIDNNGNLHVVWSDSTPSALEWGIDFEIMYANYTGAGWSNATVISDDYTLWNLGDSISPKIDTDKDGNLHVVWSDSTPSALEWGTDFEIMYANCTISGWSNATVISDDYTLWNDGYSDYPAIAIDNNGNLHVVWYDETSGEWGSDCEIMYANRVATTWSNATVISDYENDWNKGVSCYPSIAVDNDGNVHVVWQDESDIFGTDSETLYRRFNTTIWSAITVLSDDITNWNEGDTAEYTSIATDNDGNIHVVWCDSGSFSSEWGTDPEIFYVSNLVPSVPSVPSEKTTLIPISFAEPDLAAWVIAIISLIAVGILIAFIILSRRT